MPTRKSLLTILSLLSAAISVGSFIAGLLGDKTAFGIGVLVFVLAILFLFLSLKPGKSGGLNAEQAAKMLEGLSYSTRIEGISHLFPNLSLSLSGSDVSLILGDLSEDWRVDAIAILAPKIRKPLSVDEIKLVLRSISGDSRTEAIRILTSNEQELAKHPHKHKGLL